MKPITEFIGEYRWLSNFWMSPVTLGEWTFPSVEHAYQVAKSENPHDWAYVAQLSSAGQAKNAGKRLKMRANWEDIKITVMADLLAAKFTNTELRQKLINTGDAELVEGNYWGDRFWGVCKGTGQNQLGKLLMHQRSNLHHDKSLCRHRFSSDS